MPLRKEKKKKTATSLYRAENGAGIPEGLLKGTSWLAWGLLGALGGRRMQGEMAQLRGGSSRAGRGREEARGGGSWF